jgi:FkbM family methyltransferase
MRLASVSRVRYVRRWALRVIRAMVSRAVGLRAINAVHRRLSPALRQRFFYLTCDESWRVAGDWLVDFAGRNLVLPLRRDFPLAWTAAVGFHGYDPELHELYTSLVTGVSPPRVFFDVGANYGLHSLRLLAHGVRVVSFEPNPECHRFFVECCRANGLVPEIVPAAVGAETGWATLMVPVGRSYLGSIVPDVFARWETPVMRLGVPLTSLDEFAAERRVMPDLVKIDVEGAELSVLQGAQGLLAEARPVVIFESWRSAAERGRLFELFAALGYTVHDAAAERRGCALSLAGFLACPGSNFVAQSARPGARRADVPTSARAQK